MARKRPAAFRRKAAPAATAAPPIAPPLSAAGEWQARALIAAAALAVFGRALPYPLQRSWDDGRFILDNPDVQQPSWAALRRIFGEQHFEAYHPLHLLGYWLDVPWFGATPWVLHTTSLILWVLALWLLYGTLRRLAIDRAPAVLGTLACGLHPVQVEAVVWATGRKDVLAMLFGCACLWLHVSAGSPWAGRARASRASYLLALLAKTTTLPLPIFSIVLDRLVRRSRLRDALLTQLPSFVVAVAASLGVLWIWREHTMVRTTVGGPEFAPLRFVQTLGHQLLTAVWPARTAPMYETGSVAALDPVLVSAFVLWLAACVTAYRRQARIVLAGLIGWAVLMLPVSNIVPMYFPLQDRYLSLPLIGLAIAFAGLLQLRPPGGRTAALVLGALLVVGLGARTAQYAGVWESETRLWGHAASTQPDADYAWLKLGEVRRESGDLEGAIAAYQTAVHVAPLRKLAHAALFEVVALRDERIANISPSLARPLAQRYYEQLDSQTGLQELAGFLMQRGYVRTVELPLQIVISRDNLPDDALEKIARAQLREGRISLARFYLTNMKKPTEDPELRALSSQYSLRVLP